jgi:hypothetical protein
MLTGTDSLPPATNCSPMSAHTGRGHGRSGKGKGKGKGRGKGDQPDANPSDGKRAKIGHDLASIARNMNMQELQYQLNTKMDSAQQ